MIEAFANHISSHLGRHLFYWAISQSDITEFNLRFSDLINKFHAPLERGVQVLDHLLTLEEEDFNGHWGSGYVHNYEPEIANNQNVIRNHIVQENEEQMRPENAEQNIDVLRLNIRNNNRNSK